jgi:FdhD protein
VNEQNGRSAASEIATSVLAARNGSVQSQDDRLAVEEPLEIRVLVPRGAELVRHSVAVTMRTPGQDAELALGFLVTEGILTTPDQVSSVGHCPGTLGREAGNVINVTLAPGIPFDPARLSRNVYTTSSCGICGKASLDLVRATCPRRPEGKGGWTPDRLLGLGERVRRTQAVFSRTGGLHAAALFNAEGRLLHVHEDVGRHNAVDKVVGALFRDNMLPASDTLLWVSGRASFELVQKALLAGIPALAAVGAPSSLAVDAAREFGMTLVGFLREGRFNVYAGAERLEGPGFPPRSD